MYTVPKHKYANNASKEDGLLKCAYCSTKHTAMWRPGPGGHGTLCNSCGIQWKRGEILKGAIVISAQEERRLIKERKEKEKALEEAELERAEREQHKKVYKTLDSPSMNHNSSTSSSSSKKTPSTNNHKCTPASHKLNKNIPKSASTSATPEPTTVTPMNVDPADKSTPISNAPQQTEQSTNTQQGTSFHLYSQGGIPLPTLSIDLGESLVFSHPNCAVTLLDGHFHIRLSTGTAEQSFINLEKSDLTDAQFNITNEGDASLSREVLTMTLLPLSRSFRLLSRTIDEKHAIKVRFLEKLDPSGGAVVKRIIQRWLVTIPQ